MLSLETTAKDLSVQEMCRLSATQDWPTIMESRFFAAILQTPTIFSSR